MPKHSSSHHPRNTNKTTRCKWYNDLGHPRINPRKLAAGEFNPVGCTFTSEDCFYAHPDHPAWRFAKSTRPPRAIEYGDARVPSTPPPDRSLRSEYGRAPRTPERRERERERTNVKDEPTTPRLLFAESSDSITERERGSASRARLREERDWDRDMRKLERRARPNNRELREERERDSRRRDRSRSPRTTMGESSNKHTTPPPPSSVTPLIDRMFDRVPSKPRALQSPQHATSSASDHLLSLSMSMSIPPLPPTPTSPAPLIPPPPPFPSKDNSIFKDNNPTSSPRHSPTPIPTPAPTPAHVQDSIASTPREHKSESIPPDTAGSVAMPPPPTPMSASAFSVTQTQTQTLTQPRNATPAAPPSAPPTPLFLNTFQSTEAPPEKKELLSREEQAELWDKRIDLLSDAILAKKAHKDRLLDINQLTALSTPSRTANLPDSVRAQITASLQTAHAHADAAHARARAAHQRVLDLDFWPVRRRPEAYDAAAREDLVKEEEEKRGVEDEHREIRGRVGELGDSVGRLDRQMKEVTAFVKARSRAAVPQSAAPAASESSPMDWEPTDVGRGAKRRKVGDDGAYASDSGSATVAPLSRTPTPAPSTISASASFSASHPLSLPTPTHDARLTMHRISKLESQIHELENLYTQAEAAARDELTSLVEGHVERVRTETHRRLRMKHAERVERLEGEAAQMGRDVRELVDEVAELVGVKAEMGEMRRVMEEKSESDRKELEQIHASLASNELQSTKLQESLTTSASETAALRRSLTLLTQAPSPPPPHIPTVAELASALLPGLLDAVRADMLGVFEAQKRDVVGLLRGALPTLEQAAQGLIANASGAPVGGKGKGKGKGKEAAVVQVNGSVAPPKPPS